MGTCQSQFNRETDIVVTNKRKPSNPKSSPRKFTYELKHPSSSIPKNVVQTTSLISPAEGTEATMIDSPYTTYSIPYTPDCNDELMDIDDYSSAPSLSERSGYSASQDPQNLLPGGAESDDESYLLSNESDSPSPLRKGSPSGYETHPQYPSSTVDKRVQTLNARHPSQVIDRMDSPSPLLAPPKHVVVTLDSTSASPITSVHPQTMANFNRLKTQAQLATRLEKQKKLKSKIKDRRVDIQGYKNLWKEYSGIKDQALNSQNRQVETDLGLPDGVNRSISLNDSATWFVDFAAIQAQNHLDEIDIDEHIYEDDNDDDENNRSQRHFSPLSKINIEIQKRLFRKKALGRRQLGRAYSVGSKVGSLASHKNVNVDEELTGRMPESRTRSASSELQSLDFSRTVLSTSRTSESYLEDDEADNCSPNRPIAVDQVISTISDVDHNKVETADDVRSPFRFKSIKSSNVPDSDQPVACVPDSSINPEDFHAAEAFLDAPTPRVQNNMPSSLTAYVNGMYLPSVSIDNAEAGIVRWRQFPTLETQAKTARKLDFCSYDDKSQRQDQFDKDLDTPDVEGLTDNCKVVEKGQLLYDQSGAAAVESSTKALGESIRDKIKKFDPVISTRPKKASLRVSTSKEAPELVQEIEKVHDLTYSNTKIYGQQQKSTVGPKTEIKNVRLARKVGSKIDQLVSQLFEENTLARVSN